MPQQCSCSGCLWSLQQPNATLLWGHLLWKGVKMSSMCLYFLWWFRPHKCSTYLLCLPNQSYEPQTWKELKPQSLWRNVESHVWRRFVLGDNKQRGGRNGCGNHSGSTVWVLSAVGMAMLPCRNGNVHQAGHWSKCTEEKGAMVKPFTCKEL